MKPAARSSSSTRRPAQVVERIAVGKRPRGIRCRVTARSCSWRCRDRRLPALASTSRSCRQPIAPPMASASSIWRRASWCATLHSGQDPEAFDLSPDGKTMYVSNEETAEMSVLDITSGDGSRACQGRRGARRRDGAAGRREVYVTCEGDNEVLAVDTTTLKVVGRMKTAAAAARRSCSRPDGKTAFVTDETAATVSVIDTAKHAVAARS